MGGQTGDGTSNANSGNACANGPDTTSTFDTTVSVCPAGWRLPTGGAAGTNGEFEQMSTVIGATNNTAGSTALRSAWLGVYSGGYSTTTFSYQGTGGYYWSSTVYSATGAHGLYFAASIVNPSFNITKQVGFAVRCVASV